MYYYCFDCKKVFKRKTKLNICPNKCDKNKGIAQIDEMMLPIVHMLNEKGYVTLNCCSSHYGFDNQMYIQFHKKYAPDFKDLPDMFDTDEFVDLIENSKHELVHPICIRILEEYWDEDEPIKTIHIHEAIIQLIEWVNKLPYCNIDYKYDINEEFESIPYEEYDNEVA